MACSPLSSKHDADKAEGAQEASGESGSEAGHGPAKEKADKGVSWEKAADGRPFKVDIRSNQTAGQQ